jgi:hypothetical protein
MRLAAALLWVSVSSAEDPANGSAYAQLAEMRLSQGQNLLALDIARQCLEKFGGDVACRKVHARSLVQIGHCERALGELAALRHQAIWEGEHFHQPASFGGG